MEAQFNLCAMYTFSYCDVFRCLFTDTYRNTTWKGLFDFMVKQLRKILRPQGNCLLIFGPTTQIFGEDSFSCSHLHSSKILSGGKNLFRKGIRELSFSVGSVWLRATNNEAISRASVSHSFYQTYTRYWTLAFLCVCNTMRHQAFYSRSRCHFWVQVRSSFGQRILLRLLQIFT